MKPDNQKKICFASSRFFLMPHLSPFNLLHFSHTDSKKYMKSNIAARIEFPLLYLKYVIPLILLFTVNVSQTDAQGAYFWSEQKRIPEYAIENNEQPPYLIADQNHTVHAFNSQPLVLGDDDSPKAIFYRQWTIDNGWSYPNDVLFDENGRNIELIGVSSDQSGMVHMVFQKNNDEIFYTNAYLGNANNATAWSAPLFIAGHSLNIRSGIPIIGAIANEEASGEIVIIFSGNLYGNGLYLTLSADKGISWTEPYPVYLAGSESLIITDPKLFVGKSGILHAVWTTRREDGFGGPAYYSSYDFKEKSWSNPMQLDIPGIELPSVIEHHGDVYVAYYRADNNRIWWRHHINNETDWTSPSLISPQHIGRNGAASFATDSNGTLHVFFAQRINDNIHGVWHSIWTGTAWTNPESVARGPRKIDVIGGDGFDPNSVRAIISNGNVLLATWGTDGGAGSNGAWYSYIRLDTPELPALPLPVPSVTIQSASTEEILPIVTAAVEAATKPSDILGDYDDSPPSSWNPQSPILIGVISALLLLAGIMLLRYISHSRNT
jgi:hypothetical protein